MQANEDTSGPICYTEVGTASVEERSDTIKSFRYVTTMVVKYVTESIKAGSGLI